MISLCIFLSFGKTESVKVRVKDLNSSKSNGEKYEGKKEEAEDRARAQRRSPESSMYTVCLSVYIPLTTRCTDKGERDSALLELLMNDPTFVLVTGKSLDGRAAAQNNAALVCLSANQALIRSYWETVTLETERSKKKKKAKKKQSSSRKWRIAALLLLKKINKAHAIKSHLIRAACRIITHKCQRGAHDSCER